MSGNGKQSSTESLLRELAPQVLGSVARRFRDFAAAEDAVQEAMIAATARWESDGVPEHPFAWLLQVATRRMTDQIRSECARRNRESATGHESSIVVLPEVYGVSSDEPDDTLLLLFMCCHPALSPASAIALTLRAVGGLTTAEIAKAFLVPESTMGQRISRAKQSIKDSGIRLQMPDEEERAARLRSVLKILYLIFNEGYAASSGDSLHRVDLSCEAIRLTRKTQRLLPRDGEVAGLLALMLLTDARRNARVGKSGELIPLEQQDRSLWDGKLIDEGKQLVESALTQGSVSEYSLLAAVAALHDEAPSADATDWPQILALYQVLYRIAASPLVALNLAIADAMVNGAQAGLDRLDQLESDPKLKGGHRLDATRAHLLERAGRADEAVGYYRAAAAKTNNIPERNFLMLQASTLAERLL